MLHFLLHLLPLAVFAVWMWLSTRKLPDWRQGSYVLHPQRRVWAIWHMFGDEWTPDGRALRRRYLLRMAIGIVLFFGTFMLVQAFESSLGIRHDVTNAPATHTSSDALRGIESRPAA